jgi:hypothetical protein
MKSGFLRITVLLFIVFSLVISGVSASWLYLAYPEELLCDINSTTATFRYSTLYITKVSVSGGNYDTAQSEKSADLDITSQIKLNNSNSSVTIDVTFYNNTDASYYYDKTEALSHNNSSIEFVVSGINQKDEVPPKTFKTVSVTYQFSGNNTTNKNLASSLRFHFVIDKSSIGGVVAQTAVDRFRDILNNKVSANSYDTLDNAMNNRSGFNKESAVTYIGNVSGSSSSDSKVIQTLFGNEFMSMDLDGDGKIEPITMMIKRENLDHDDTSGASYTYSSWGRNYTVDGVEMTLYITSENLSNVSSNKAVVVYAAVFTKYSENEEWVQITPLVKGKANANNYSGYGSANSFNTDTWVSDNNKTIETIVAENTK